MGALGFEETRDGRSGEGAMPRAWLEWRFVLYLAQQVKYSGMAVCIYFRARSLCCVPILLTGI